MELRGVLMRVAGVVGRLLHGVGVGAGAGLPGRRPTRIEGSGWGRGYRRAGLLHLDDPTAPALAGWISLQRAAGARSGEASILLRAPSGGCCWPSSGAMAAKTLCPSAEALVRLWAAAHSRRVRGAVRAAAGAHRPSFGGAARLAGSRRLGETQASAAPEAPRGRYFRAEVFAAFSGY